MLVLVPVLSSRILVGAVTIKRHVTIGKAMINGHHA
jgi:hypothetical protein